ncbi:MAG: VWA domain-containing protein [Candidatus Neomarinimicrobiota bacterium]
MFRFAYPFLLLLLIPTFAYAIYDIFFKKAKHRALRFGSTKTLEDHTNRFYYKLLIPRILIFGAIVLLIIALARPQEGQSNRDIKVKGVDIMLALDISGSMQLNDFTPNRLAASKRVARDFVKARTHDRIGLVVFAGESFLQCPLTTDYDVVDELISKMEIVPQSLDGTAIGLAISNCINRLRDTEAKSKVIILLTDGENNAGDIDPMTAAGFASDFDVKIYTIGMAGSGGRTGGFFSQRIPPLNEELLKEISNKTGGKFYRADTQEKLEEVWADISKLEKTEINARDYMDWVELYYLYLLFAFMSALLAFILKNILWRKV